MATASNRRLSADDAAGPLKPIEENSPVIDEVPHGGDYRQLFANEAFMNERVVILLHPNQDNSEVGVPVSVNGKRVYLIPNKPMAVPRTHVAQLLKARPDSVIHRSDDYTVNEAEHNKMYRQSTSRYNFDVIKDTPKGTAWLRELRSQFTSW